MCVLKLICIYYQRFQLITCNWNVWAAIFFHAIHYRTLWYISSYSQGNTSQPIWLTNTNCAIVYSCLTSCTSCPSSDEQVTNCVHQEDVNVHCGKLHAIILVFFDRFLKFHFSIWINIKPIWRNIDNLWLWVSPWLCIFW